jgi:hypothetical protein
LPLARQAGRFRLRALTGQCPACHCLSGRGELPFGLGRSGLGLAQDLRRGRQPPLDVGQALGGILLAEPQFDQACVEGDDAGVRELDFDLRVGLG